MYAIDMNTIIDTKVTDSHKAERLLRWLSLDEQAVPADESQTVGRLHRQWSPLSQISADIREMVWLEEGVYDVGAKEEEGCRHSI